MIRVSVVIPARNREATLIDCLDSVVSQTYPPSEVIVVDDYSDDATPEIAARYAGNGVRCVRLPEMRGAQAARNEGVKRARFEWIAFQDSDDVWLPRKLEIQVKELARHSRVADKAVHCNAIKHDLTCGSRSPLELDVFSGRCYALLLLKPGPMFPALLVHKSKLLEIGLLDEACPSFQEWDSAIRLARVCEFVHVEDRLFEWRWHAGDTISKSLSRDFHGYQYVIEKHRSEIIRLHGKLGWKRVMTANVARGLTFRLFDEP